MTKGAMWFSHILLLDHLGLSIDHVLDIPVYDNIPEGNEKKIKLKINFSTCDLVCISLMLKLSICYRGMWPLLV